MHQPDPTPRRRAARSSSLPFYAALFLQLLAATVVGADSATIKPSADTTLFEIGPDNNLGASLTGVIGTTAEGARGRWLLKFDVTSALPPGSIVKSATLSLTVTKSRIDAPIQVTLHRVLQNWGEGRGGDGATIGAGDLALAGEASWNFRTAKSSRWSVAGAASPSDFAATESSATTLAGPGSYKFESTPGLTTDVQGWLEHPEGNFGWIAVSESEAAKGTAKRVASREDPTAGAQLIVTYDPAPATVAPKITLQPQPLTVVAGNPATFKVTATGTTPLQFQWRRNGDPIPDATSDTFTLPKAQASDEGTYSVLVQNPAGSVTSDGVGLFVRPAPLSIVLKPVADTSIFEVKPDNNYGTSRDLRSGTTAQGKRSRLLVRFDPAAALPTNAVITNVSLSVTVTRQPGGGGSPSVFELRRVIQRWEEGIHDDQPASPTEPTWIRRSGPDSPWLQPGGEIGTDVAAEPSASAPVGGLGIYQFGPSAGLVADLEAWLASPLDNHGWVLMSQSEGTPQTAREFGSSENANASPELHIGYLLVSDQERPQIESIGSDAAQVRLRCKKAGSLRIVIERTSNLATPQWAPVATVGQTPDGIEQEHLEPIGGGSAFYRLRVIGREP